jgi:hypothetical protein
MIDQLHNYFYSHVVAHEASPFVGVTIRNGL